MKSLDELLKEIETRAERAPSGPYYAIRRNYDTWVCRETTQSTDSEQFFTTVCDIKTDNFPIADFFAHARQDVPRLLELVKKLREQRDESIRVFVEDDLGVLKDERESRIKMYIAQDDTELLALLEGEK